MNISASWKISKTHPSSSCPTSRRVCARVPDGFPGGGREPPDVWGHAGPGIQGEATAQIPRGLEREQFGMFICVCDSSARQIIIHRQQSVKRVITTLSWDDCLWYIQYRKYWGQKRGTICYKRHWPDSNWAHSGYMACISISRPLGHHIFGKDMVIFVLAGHGK